MTTINELKKKYQINRDELITGLDEDELKRKILMLTKSHYISYLNNDEKLYYNTVNILEFIAEIYSSVNDKTDYYNNINNFINYCMVLSINEILSHLIKRDLNLKEPYFTDLKDSEHKSNLESFNDVSELPAFYGIIEDSDMIRSDADLETVKSIYPQLKTILTPHSMEWIDNFINTAENKKAIIDDKKQGWRNDL